jgi:hypothetical protein
MKPFPTLIGVGVAAGLAALTGAQGIEGSGRMRTEQRTVPNFTAVHHAGIGDVTIRAGERLGVTVEADDNVLPLVTTEVRDGTLTINTRETIRKAKIRVVVSVPTVDRIRLAGAGNLEGRGLRGRILTVDLNGAGNLTLHGEVDRLTATLRGAGNMTMRELRAGRAEVRISGAGHADIHAVQSLQAHISGAGSIRYAGNPEVQKRVTGAGRIAPLK